MTNRTTIVFMEAAKKRMDAKPHGVGWAIRRLRKSQERTLESLAAAIGADAGNLSRVERGAQDLPARFLAVWPT